MEEEDDMYIQQMNNNTDEMEGMEENIEEEEGHYALVPRQKLVELEEEGAYLEARTIFDEFQVKPSHGGLSSDGSLLFAFSQSQLELFHCPSNQTLSKWTFPSSRIECAKLVESKKKTMLLVGLRTDDNKGMVQLFDLKKALRLPGHQKLLSHPPTSFSYDEKEGRIIVGTREGKIYEYSAEWGQGKNREKMEAIDQQLVEQGFTRLRVVALAYSSHHQILFASYCGTKDNINEWFFTALQRNPDQDHSFTLIYCSLSDPLFPLLPFSFFIIPSEESMWVVQTAEGGKRRKGEEGTIVASSVFSLFSLQGGRVVFSKRQMRRDGRVIAFSFAPLLFTSPSSPMASENPRVGYVVGEQLTSSPASSYFFLDFLPLPPRSSSPSSSPNNNNNNEERLMFERVILRALSAPVAKRGRLLGMKVNWVMVEGEQSYSMNVKVLQEGKYYSLVVKESGSPLWEAKNIGKGTNMQLFEGSLLLPSLCHLIPLSPFARKFALHQIKSFRRSFLSSSSSSSASSSIWPPPPRPVSFFDEHSSLLDAPSYHRLHSYLLTHYALSQSLQSSHSLSQSLQFSQTPHDEYLQFSSQIEGYMQRLELAYWLSSFSSFSSFSPSPSSSFLHRMWPSLVSSSSIAFTIPRLMKTLDTPLTLPQLSSFIAIIYYLLIASPMIDRAVAEEFGQLFNLPIGYQRVISGLEKLERGEYESSWEEIVQGGLYVAPFFFLLLRSFYAHRPLIALRFYLSFSSYRSELLPSFSPSFDLHPPHSTGKVENEEDEENEENIENVKVIFDLLLEMKLFDKAVEYARSKEFQTRKMLLGRLLLAISPHQLEQLGLFPIDSFESQLFASHPL